MRLHFILLYLTFFSSIFACPLESIRAVWLTTNYQLDWPSSAGTSQKVIIKQQQELCDIVRSLSRLGINTIFFQTRLKGTVMHKSSLEHQSRFLTGRVAQSSDFDPLAYMVSLCRAYNIQCHAWMVCMPLGSPSEINNNGLSGFIKEQKSNLVYHKNQWYLDPSKPFAADYLADIAQEIVQNYAVHGVHLDYIRYPDRVDGYPDLKSYQKSHSLLSLEDWRRENITQIVSSIYDRVKSIDSTVSVSSAPLGMLYPKLEGEMFHWTAYQTVYQDVEEWVNRGKQDFVVPMIYFDTPTSIKAIYQWKKHITRVPVIPGLGIYKLNEKLSKWHVSDIRQQLYAAELNGCRGYALFRTNNLLVENLLLNWVLRDYNM